MAIFSETIKNIGMETLDFRDQVSTIEHLASQRPSVSILLVSSRPHLWGNALENINRQNYSNIMDVIFVGNTNEDRFKYFKFLVKNHLQMDINLKHKLLNGYRWFKNMHSLGKSLNFAQSQAIGEIFVKMDDDDLYGANYITDSIRAMVYNDADVIVKPNGFVYFAQPNKLCFLPRVSSIGTSYNELRTPTPVFGGTLIWKRHVFKKVKFKDINKGEDTKWMIDIRKGDFKIVAGDPWNYVWIRKDNSQHTYKFNYSKILNSTVGRHITNSNELKLVFL
jgi:hypothetical protein